MRKISIYIIIFFLLFQIFPEAQARNLENKRTYRKFVLENGLKVVLVSDPDMNIASASMDVSVGSLANPKERQGLAHFLEHMLFLGTKKYPELNAYGKYVKDHGGYTNAYTASDHTNYHFQVLPGGLPEALDRFGHFFIAPLMDPKYTAKEVRAVHSEHQKNIPQDTWRLMQLRKKYLKANHPANSFSTGNLETLGTTTPKELNTFFRTYYGPESMALCVMSTHSLDSLEKMVRNIFSQIKKNKIKKFTTTEDILEKKDHLRLFKVVPVKDIRQLKLYFAVPSLYGEVFTKTDRLLGMTMGDEGKGSLLSLLKEKGLATSLSAGASPENRFFSSCSITIGLTQKGLKKYREVLRLCFSYIHMLKKSKFPYHVWNELKKMAKLRELYAPKGEGTEAATHLANLANNFGIENVEKIDYIYTKPNPKAYKKLLRALTPDNMLVFLIAKGLKTEKTEKWYGTKYSLTTEKSDYYKSLAKTKIDPKLHLPLPNPFTPSNIAVIPEQPVLILKTPKITMWYAQDNEFLRPKVALYIEILTPKVYRKVRDAVLTNIYTSLIQEKLNEFAYPALMAGLSYSLSSTRQGIFLSVQGYSDSALKLLHMVGKELPKTNFSQKMFTVVKERLVRGLRNFPLSRPTGISSVVSRKINLRKYFTPAQLLQVAPKIELSDLKQFVGTLYNKAHIRGLSCGNLSAKQVKTAMKNLANILKYEAFSPKKAWKDEVLWQSSPQTVFFTQAIPSNNSCLRIEYQVGVSDLKTKIAAQIISQAIKNSFYTEMRTKQMLGYIVYSGGYARENVETMCFIIQSASNDSYDLFQRADTFIKTLPEQFEKIPDQVFEIIRKSLIKRKMRKEKSIAEKAAKFYILAFQRKGDFNYIQKEIDMLKKISKKEVTQVIKDTLGKKARRIVILLNAKNHKKPKVQGIKDIKAFHKKCVFDK